MTSVKLKCVSLFLLVPLLLFSGYSVPVDQCENLTSAFQMVENIDSSQYVNFPLAVEVRAYDIYEDPRAGEECTITTYTVDGKVVDVVRAIHPDEICAQVETGFFAIFQDDKLVQDQLQGRLVTDDQGFMRYALELGDKYQSDNQYIIRVDCGNSCTRQSFEVLRSTVGFGVYNSMLGIIENADWIVWVILGFLLLCLIVASVLVT